jgi:ATP:cob(I)alamin adenosyltransferase
LISEPSALNDGAMKIYTKTGDDGTTGLLGGQRVRKSDPRIDCFGAIDELNAMLGWSAVAARQGGVESLATQLADIQADLFTLGSHLAVAEGSGADRNLPPLDDAIVARLEMEIDAADGQLPELRNFILPGGGELAARLHHGADGVPAGGETGGGVFAGPSDRAAGADVFESPQRLAVHPGAAGESLGRGGGCRVAGAV